MDLSLALDVHSGPVGLLANLELLDLFSVTNLGEGFGRGYGPGAACVQLHGDRAVIWV